MASADARSATGHLCEPTLRVLVRQDVRQQQGECMRQFVNTSRGLTIIEMMGAMLVSTILLSGVWQLFQGGMRSYQRGLQDVRMTQEARALLHLVTRDVQRAMAARAPYGIQGAASQLSASDPAERPVDGLAMLTLPSPGAPSEGAPHGGAL